METPHIIRTRSFAMAFLASVTSAEEARLAVLGGADIIDCKDPAQGALGALRPSDIQTIVAAVGTDIAVSATIGDLPSDPEVMVNAARIVASTGVMIVKAGFFGDTDPRPAIAALGAADLGACRRFAVLMADRNPDFTVLDDLRAAGFLGVMLDTADKRAGALPDVMSNTQLAEFVSRASALALVTGLAGSLGREHIEVVDSLGADIAGFRGALCEGGRTNALSADRVAAVRATLDALASSSESRTGHTRWWPDAVPTKRHVA